MDKYTVSFRQMAGGGIDLDVDPSELDFLLSQGLVEIRGLRIRTSLLPELVKFHSNVPDVKEMEEIPADG